MKTSRIEAFSDGVLAIIITIMVLELKPPRDTSLQGLISIAPTFISYLVSFIYVGVYWNSHHHLFQVTETVNGKILWANLHLLFWLSLIPFTTAWIGEHHIESVPVALYGFVFFMSGIGFLVLKRQILNNHPETSPIHQMLGSHNKEYLSLAIYLIGIGFAFVHTTVAIICFMGVALVWFLPDTRIEGKI